MAQLTLPLPGERSQLHASPQPRHPGLHPRVALVPLRGALDSGPSARVGIWYFKYDWYLKPSQGGGTDAELFPRVPQLSPVLSQSHPARSKPFHLAHLCSFSDALDSFCYCSKHEFSLLAVARYADFLFFFAE